ncbi:TPA: hypothetical protein OUE88_002120 [Pseudomonas aeruginosa]|uniref:hypothetical protein n=1 Tax=Pseudomonas aeruginosa TaxID=287 RepID=UPI0018DEBDB9|nr:hypothetical protein [Pseudomonas aeruginosa]MBH8258562.1 hypothetical protein [Pseudomonas aeruginosa]MDI2409434.1 hypothetical protein [Pseudomonas aeruginosa]HCU0326758.1 hypothetical protein [Pseudomonas aeruginosa]
MTDINKLKELAVRALPFAPGEWFVENGIDQVRDCANDFVCETGEDEPIKASFIAAANPQAILKLIAEVEHMRRFAAEAYQVLGALDAPENVLDNASDAANGVPLRHETLLPFFAEGYEALRKDAERYRAIRQKDRGGVVVRDRTSHLFGESLDAAIDAALEGGGR